MNRNQAFRTFAAALALLVLVLAVSSAQTDDRFPANVREKVTKLVEAGDCVGIVVALVDSSGTYYFSRGKLSKTSDRPVNENTVFEIGSITKVFTCIALADMVEDRLVALDDPVQKFLPASSRVPTRGSKEITLRDLATHRSGLPRVPDNTEPKDLENPYADFTGENLLQFLNGYTLDRDIGSAYEYSNLGMGLLGYVLAQRAGMSYEALVIERVCDPLTLKDTRITLSEDQRNRLAQGYLGNKPVKNWDFNALAGCGALRSTARDLAHFISANLGLTDTPLEKTLRAAYAGRTETGESGSFVALGWGVLTSYETTIIWHNGQTGGYHSFCGFNPSKKLGVVVLANSSNDIDDIGRHLLEPKYELAAVVTAAEVPVAVLDEYVGYYELAPGAVLHVTREGEQLSAQLTGQDAYPVYAMNETTFFYKIVDAQLTFVRDAGGKIDHLVLHQNGNRTAKKITDYTPPIHVEVAVDSTILARYVGKYQLAPGAVFDVILESGQLRIKLASQPRFPVYPESQTKFFYKVVEAQITFETDEHGNATGLILHQGGLDQRAKKIE